MHRFLQRSIDYVFPPLCVHCQREGDWLCTDARRQIAKIPLLENPVSIPGVDVVLCGGDYDRPELSRFIQQVKYHYRTASTSTILPVLLTPLRSRLMTIEPQTVIVPTPLHWRRRLARGFNQSELIAAALGHSIARPVQPLIRRRRFTKPQATLTSAERAINVTGAFELQRVAKIPNSVILVDDVITTGSTIRECASVLRHNGVQKIFAVALAKG